MAKQPYNWMPEWRYPWIRPSPVSMQDKEARVQELARYALVKTASMFEYRVPDTIRPWYMENMIEEARYTILLRHQDKIYPLWGGFVEEPDRDYQPREAIITNPYFDDGKEHRAVFGENAVLIWNDHQHMGLLPLINKYATLICENELSIWMGDILTRLTVMVTADDDNQRETAARLFDDLKAGKLGEIVTKSFGDEFGGKTGAQPMITGTSSSTLMQHIELEQYLKASLLNELGLNSNWNGKRESLNSVESNMNFDGLLPLPDDMLRCRQEGLEQANKLFADILDEPMTVRFASAWETLRDEQQAVIDGRDQSKTDQEVQTDGD